MLFSCCSYLSDRLLDFSGMQSSVWRLLVKCRKISSFLTPTDLQEKLRTSLGSYLNPPVTFQLLCTEITCVNLIQCLCASEQTPGSWYFSSSGALTTDSTTLTGATTATSSLGHAFLDTNLLLSLVSVQLSILLSPPLLNKLQSSTLWQDDVCSSKNPPL